MIVSPLDTALMNKNTKYIPYGRQWIDEDDIAEVIKVLRSDYITTGPKVAEFEEAFANYLEVKYAVSFSSGTAALHGAVFSAGLEPGDEAITTPLTFCATANCILYQGGTPVFADVCPDTLNLNPEEVSRRITSKTKLVLPVDYAGHPADLEAIQKIADAHGLIVIEDACHSLGAEYRNIKVGGICRLNVFSFHPVKHITTGEGGMVTTNDSDLARRLRIFRNHGIDRDTQQRKTEGDWFYQMITLGYNYRLTDIGCALGLSQLQKLNANLERRREIAGIYTSVFRQLPGVIVPIVRENINPAWHLYPLRLDLDQLQIGRAEIFRKLHGKNIGVNVHYIPVHLHPYYRQRFGYRGGEYPIAEAAYGQLISLPIFPKMGDDDVKYVIKTVQNIISASRK